MLARVQSIAWSLVTVLIAGTWLEAISRLGVWASERDLRLRPTATLFAASVLLCGVAALLLMPARALVRAGRRGRAFLYVAAAAALLLAPVGAELARGPWISRQRFAWAVAYAAAPLAAAIVGLGSVACLHALSRLRGWGRSGVALACVAAGSTLVWLHVTQLAGLYRPLHLACMGLAAWTVQLSVGSLAPARWLERRSGRVLTFVGAAAGALLLVSTLPPSEAVVAELVHRSERSRYLLQSLRPRSQPDEIRRVLAEVDGTPASTPKAGQAAIRLPPDWNVVLIVVDTMRADVVPATTAEHPAHRFSAEDAPTLSWLAKSSTRFARAYASSVWTGYSMPAMFRSREGHETQVDGISLATRMARLGRYPVAVVPEFFTHRWGAEADPKQRQVAVERLLDGMAEVEVYADSRQFEQASLTYSLLKRVSDRPFFAWLHYFALHAPGWDEHGFPYDVAWPEAYRRSLRWLDKQLAGVFGMLNALGVARRTLVVVTSDHGEGLGDHGVLYHGPAIWEEVVRVPLMLHFPGARGRVIPATVGNIDLAPTLSELLGGAAMPADRGRSLVPLLAGARDDATRPYVIYDGVDERAAAVVGDRKHVVDLLTGAHLSFDLDASPWEQATDAAGLARDPARDAIVALRPELFVDGTLDPELEALLDERLRAVDPGRRPRGLPFLLRLIGLAPSAERLAWAARLLRETGDDEALLSVIALLAKHDASLLARTLRERILALEPAERTKLVSTLAQLSTPVLEPRFAFAQLLEASRGAPEDFQPWLELVADGDLNAPFDPQALINILRTLAPHDDGALLASALTAVAHLRVPLTADQRETLFELVAARASAKSAMVRAPACLALGALGEPRAEPLLRAKLDAGPFLVRLRALQGLAALIGDRVVGDLERAARDPRLLVHATVLAGELRSEEALTFLDSVERSAPPLIGYEARLAKQRIVDALRADAASTTLTR